MCVRPERRPTPNMTRDDYRQAHTNRPSRTYEGRNLSRSHRPAGILCESYRGPALGELARQGPRGRRFSLLSVISVSGAAAYVRTRQLRALAEGGAPHAECWARDRFFRRHTGTAGAPASGASDSQVAHIAIL